MEFMFGVPSLVQFGEGISGKVGEFAKDFGAKKVFVVYDKGVKAAGIMEGIFTSFNSAGVEFAEYDGVLPNPPDYQVEEAAELARAANADLVVAVGGGSSIDTAKAIAILLTNPSPLNQYEGINTVPIPGKPLIAIPTTSGTGSEVTWVSVITAPKETRKMGFVGRFVGPTMALLDPLLTVGMPPKITAATGMDALTHAIEAYTSKTPQPPCDALALKAIELISANIVEATKNGSNVEARSAMQIGSMQAGIAFNNAMVALVHAIAHPLSAHCNLPHGVANAAALPYCMEFNASVKAARFKDIAAAMGIDVTGMSDEAGAQAAIDKVKALNKELEIPTLSQCDVSRDKLDAVADSALQEMVLMFNPREVTKQDVLAILEKAY